MSHGAEYTWVPGVHVGDELPLCERWVIMLVHTTMSLAARPGAAGCGTAGAAATSGLIRLVSWRLGSSARRVPASGY